MTKEEAKQQIEAFFRRLGERITFSDEKFFAKARIGEAFLGFEYDARDGFLSCQALIYRFRRAPRDEIIDAAFAEDERQSGGGRVVFDSENLSLYLQRDFAEKITEEKFYEQINRLAAASLEWSGTILGRIAEKSSAG